MVVNDSTSEVDENAFRVAAARATDRIVYERLEDLRVIAGNFMEQNDKTLLPILAITRK
jgi:uncharacterized membrane-anchored protein